jgi:hypothetical protein
LIAQKTYKNPKTMEEGLINRALRRFVIEKGTDLREVQDYLLLKHKIEVELDVLRKRLEKLSNSEKAVA